MEELKLEEEGHEDEERKRAEADRETAADRWVYFLHLLLRSKFISM